MRLKSVSVYIGVFYSMLQSGPSIMHDAFVSSGLFFLMLLQICIYYKHSTDQIRSKRCEYGLRRADYKQQL